MTRPAGHVLGPIAVVGSSLAGLNAAEALLESDRVGPVTVFGAEEHLPYDRPPLSKELLTGTWERERCALELPDDPRLTWRTGVQVTGLDTVCLRLVFADGGTARFDGGIVIATGTVPRSLPGADLAGVHLLRTLDDALALRDDIANGSSERSRRVVIAGGGFIGTEVAAACTLRGHEVTVLEAQTAPFERVLGGTVGAAVVAPLLERGMRLVTGVSVTGVEGDGRAEAVTLRGGGSVPADVVVLGLGVEPATDWLAGSGLRLDGGVHCDATLSVADRIVAAGDVARWPNAASGEFRRIEHWDNAVRQGRHAARRLLAHHGIGEALAFTSVPWVWSDLYDHKIQVVGSTVGFDEVRIAHGSTEDSRFVALYRRGDRLAAAFGMNQPRLVAGYRRMLSRPVAWDETVAGLEQPAGAATRPAG